MEWKSVTLEDVCLSIFAGGDVPKNKLSKTKTPKFSIPIFGNGEKFDGLYGYTDEPRVNEPSVTVSARGTIGYSVIRHEPYFPVVRLIVLIPNSKLILLKYLYYAITSMKFVNSGTSIPQLTVPMIKNYRLALPPIDEQKRIVAMLDEAFADIEKARELTEQNLKNARELFESYLHHQLTPHNDWCVSKLGEVSEISYGYTDSASFEVSGPKFLRITDIKGGSVDWDSVPFCQISSEDYNKHKLKSGDIVFARTGATTGKSYLVENPPEAVAASYLIRVRLDQGRVNPRYVRYFFETRNYWDSVNSGTSGSAQGGFNASKLANLEIYFPTELDTQDVLIEKLEIISRMIEDVNKIYLEKLKNLNELKSGLFSKVFSRG